jgi:putative oxidoreductase
METKHENFMIRKIVETDRTDVTSFVLRIILAGVIFLHGLQKLTGAFGGYGFDGTMNYFTGTVGLPWSLGVVVILVESIGMIFLAIGFMTRAIAFVLVIIMAGAAFMHYQNGFFMNWFNNQAGEGLEFFIITCALSLNSIIKGAGKFSIDSLFSKDKTVAAVSY